MLGPGMRRSPVVQAGRRWRRHPSTRASRSPGPDAARSHRPGAACPVPAAALVARDDPAQHPAHVRVDGPDRLPERDRRDGPRGVRPDPGHRLELGDGPTGPAHRARRRSAARPATGQAPAGCSRGPARPAGRPPGGAAASDSTVGNLAMNRVHASPARAACVCCAMASRHEDRVRVGRRAERRGSRPVASYQARIASRGASGGTVDRAGPPRLR